jgi:YHS domain-containing protein
VASSRVLTVVHDDVVRNLSGMESISADMNLELTGETTMISRRALLGLAGGFVLAASTSILAPAWIGGTAAAQTSPVFTGIIKGVAVGGYDPVAYFTDKKPVRGNPSISLEHGGAKYHFASEANRQTFQNDPAKYAPQYGGYCAWAIAEGYTAPGDPNYWTIHGGKLFLNYNRSVRANWEMDIPGFLAKSEVNWPKVIGAK